MRAHRDRARRPSIRSRLLLVVLLVLVPLTVLQAGLHYRSFQVKRADAAEANLEIARATAAVFDTYVDDIVAQETTVGLAMIQLVPSSHAQAHDYLRDAAHPYAPIVVLSWVSPDGRVLVSTRPHLEGTTVAHAEWLSHLRSQGRWYLTNMHRMADANADTFTLATAVRDPRGGLAGIVVADLQASKLGTWLRVQRGPLAAINLVDASGWVVYRYPTESLPYQLRNWGQRYAPIAAALRGQESADRIYAAGERRYRLIAEVPIHSLGWAAGASRNEADVLGESRRVLAWDLGALAGVALLALLAALLAGREITGPIERLHDHAWAVTEGAPARPLPPGGPAEVAELTESLNQMAETLQAREAERERARQEREEQARLLDTVVENTRAHLAYLDRNFIFVQVNAAYAASSGHTREELIGHNHFDLFPNEENQRIFERVRDTGESVQFIAKPFEYADQPERGVTYWDWTLVPVKDAHGVVQGLVLSLLEVTDQVRQRERLLAAERARAELAEHLNDEISHRVKNNLAMISGLLHMQALRQGDPRLTEALRDAITRVRTFASIHELMYAGQVERIDLLEAVRRVADMNRDVFANGRPLSITTTGESLVCSSRTATNLSVVANELITNALKHGGPVDGRVRVEVRLRVEGDTLRLEVFNSGDHVPPDLSSDPAQGMGLMLVRELVDHEYGGQFTLCPAEGGALACVTLPVSSCTLTDDARSLPS